MLRKVGIEARLRGGGNALSCLSSGSLRNGCQMQAIVFLSAGVAGFAYGITPGPGVLAVLGIGADRGRRAGAAFLGGHFAGDLVWYSLALISIIGATSIDQTVFRVLGLVSGAYLIYLGATAVFGATRSSEKLPAQARRPFVYGLLFGVTNPKSYPVAAAMFTALLASQAASLHWANLPVLLLAAACGSFTAYLVLVLLVGLRSVRSLYRRYEIWIKRLSGLMFIAFGGHSLADSLRR